MTDSAVTVQGSPLRRWLAVGSLAAVLAPVAILIHEAGHFLCYVAFGFPDPQLSYGSAGWAGLRQFNVHMQAGEFAAATELASIPLSGVAAAVGPLLTYMAIGIGLWGLSRLESIMGAALAVAAAARVVVLIPVLTGQSQGTDEARLALAFGVPETPFHLLGFVACLAGVGGSFLLLRRQGRAPLLAPLIVGTVLGVGIWMGALGSLLLP